MTNTKTITLNEAVEAARKLPNDTQAALASELMEYIEDVSTIERPSDRQNVIKDRLAKPFKAISRDEFMAMLRQYNPTL